MQRFSQCRVRMDRALQILGAGLELHRQSGFRDQFARHRSHDVHAQNRIGFARGQNLGETDRRFRETDEHFRRIEQEDRERARYLDERVDKLVSAIGEFITTQEQAGFQMMIARMDKELIELWDAPADTPFFARL